MSAARLLAIDLDGTLIGPPLSVSPADAAAIRSAGARGMEICIATGRLFSAGRPYAAALGLDGYLIALNGAAVFDVRSGRMAHAVQLDPTVALAALDELRRRGFRAQLYFDDTMYLDGVDARSDEYVRRSRIVPVQVPDLRALLTGEPPPGPGPMKILGIGTPADVESAVVELAARFGPAASVFRSQREYIEVTDPEAGKGTALTWVAAQRGIPLANVAAIGDSDNDVPMFAVAGRSYAVEGCTPLARSRAKAVVGPQGVGVAEAIADLQGFARRGGTAGAAERA